MIGWLLFIILTLNNGASAQTNISPELRQVADSTLEINTSGIEVDFRLGFGDVGFGDHANVAVFRLANQTDRVIRGRVLVEYGYLRQGRNVQRYEWAASAVELGQGATRSESMLFPLMRDGSMIVRLVDDEGKTLWQRYHYIERIEPRGGSLRLWSVTSGTSALEAGRVRGQMLYANQRGIARLQPGVRPIHEGVVPPWALPSDPHVLAIGEGVLLGSEALDKLTGAQESALARFVANGGLLFIPAEASEFEQRVCDRVRFEKKPLDDRSVALGLGKILRYSASAFSANQREESRWIYEVLDETPNRFRPLVTPSVHRYASGSGARASGSQRACLWFAGLFTLFTGPVAWGLRKWPRRRFLWTLGTIVVMFGVYAILLGLHLQRKPGELWWSTVTEIARTGGGVQTGGFALESAGARKHHLTLTEPETRFRQWDGSDYWRHYRMSETPGQADVPLLPWASRVLMAENDVPEVEPLACQLVMDEGGDLILTWENPNAFRVLSVTVGLTSGDGRVTDAWLSAKRGNRQVNTDKIGYLGGTATVLPGANRVEMGLRARSSYSGGPEIVLSALEDEDVSMMRSGVDLHFWPSLLAQLGAQPYAGYAIFEVDRSPGMEINAEATAFVSGNGRHFVFQVLPVEELPPYEKVFTTEPFPQGPPVDDSRRRVIQR